MIRHHNKMLTAWQTTCVLTLLTSARQVLGITFQLPKIGGCPDLTAQQHFISNMDNFLGKWYVQSSYDTEILQGKARCMTATYSYIPVNNKVLVATKQYTFLGKWYVQSSDDTEILQGKARCMTATYSYIPVNNKVLVATKQFNEENNQWERLDADAQPANMTTDEGKFTVKFKIPIWGEVSGTYTVLGTDYENYSVIHGCGSFFGILHYDCSWLMSKEQKMDPEEEKQFYVKAGEVLKNYENLDLKEYKKVDQINCAMPE